MDLLLPLALGLIVGLAIGVVAGALVVTRGRRAREAAVAVELIAARQRAERAAGEAHALRTRLQTTEVLAARALDLESDLVTARRDAERAADLAIRLEVEIATMRAGRRMRVADQPSSVSAAPPQGRAPGPGRAARALATPARGGAADVAVVDAHAAIAVPEVVAPTRSMREAGPAGRAMERAPSRASTPASGHAARPAPLDDAPATAVTLSPAPPIAGQTTEAIAATGPAVDPFEPPPLRPRRTRTVTACRTFEPPPDSIAGSPEAPTRATPGVPTAQPEPSPPEPAAPGVSEPHPRGWSPVRPGLADPWTWLGTPSPSGVPYEEDDLQRIHGVGPYLARRLRDEGILTWRQVAEWDEDDMALVSRRIGSFPDRIRREDWTGSARALHAEVYGERLP